MNKKTVIEMHDIVKTFYIGTPNELEILHDRPHDVKNVHRLPPMLDKFFCHYIIL